MSNDRGTSASQKNARSWKNRLLEKKVANAAQKGKTQDVKKALELGLSPVMDTKTFTTVVKRGYSDILEVYLEHGLDPNSSLLGWGPLLYEVIEVNSQVYGSVEDMYPFVEILLKHGAEANLQAKNGLTALHRIMMTRCHRAENIVRLLLEHGADVNLQDNRGYTPLMTLFVYLGGDSILFLDLFYKYGLNPFVSVDGETARDFAWKAGMPQVVRRLEVYEEDYQKKHPNWNVRESNRLQQQRNNEYRQAEKERMQQMGFQGGRKIRRGRTRKGKKAGRTRKGRKTGQARR